MASRVPECLFDSSDRRAGDVKRAALLALSLFVLIADQATKYLARISLAHVPPRHFGILTLLYTENRGAFLSLGSNFPESVRTAVFDIVVGIGLAVATVVLLRGKLQRGDDIAVAAIIGGGIGNLIDRLRFEGRVTDFLYLAAGPLLLSWMFARRTVHQ
ncbi:MAG: hypothetical protein DMF59_07980 [Acidobacteria bacterium]|nr:MAG: hypothetical protein DMF59_07980 [Acidobacteriota bacterium]